jgi:hypothetical protein
MRGLKLSERELDHYWQVSKKDPRPYVRIRALGIILVAKGYSYRKIGQFLCVSVQTLFALG